MKTVLCHAVLNAIQYLLVTRHLSCERVGLGTCNTRCLFYLVPTFTVSLIRLIYDAQRQAAAAQHDGPCHPQLSTARVSIL